MKSPESQSQPEKSKVVSLDAAKKRKRFEKSSELDKTRIQEAVRGLIEGSVTELKFIDILRPLRGDLALPLVYQLRENAEAEQRKKREISEKEKEIQEIKSKNSVLWGNILNALYEIEEE